MSAYAGKQKIIRKRQTLMLRCRQAMSMIFLAVGCLTMVADKEQRRVEIQQLYLGF